MAFEGEKTNWYSKSISFLNKFKVYKFRYNKTQIYTENIIIIIQNHNILNRSVLLIVCQDIFRSIGTYLSVNHKVFLRFKTIFYKKDMCSV